VVISRAKRARFSLKATSASRSSSFGEEICLVQTSSLLRSQGGRSSEIRGTNGAPLRDELGDGEAEGAKFDTGFGEPDNIPSVFGVLGASTVHLPWSSPGLGGTSRVEVLGELSGVVMKNADLKVVGVDEGSDSGNSWVSGVFGSSKCCGFSASSTSRTGSLSTFLREDPGRDNFLVRRFILFTMRYGQYEIS
jgi:hypothetical protein